MSGEYAGVLQHRRRRTNRRDPPTGGILLSYDREYAWTPVGEGAVNWDGLLRALVRRGYSGFIALEPHSRRAHAEEAWRQSIEFVRARIGG